MDILNNREFAVFLWFGVFSAYFFSAPKMVEFRSSFKRLLDSLFCRQIVFVLCLMVVYISVIIYFLYEVNIWNAGQIKNTVFWSFSVGFISIFKFEQIKTDNNFLKNLVLDNLKLLTVFQFIIGVYNFSLLVELLIAPVLVLLVIMLAISKADGNQHHIKAFLEYCLALFGLFLIIHALYMLITNFSEFANEKTAYDFFIPPLLTLCYLPFLCFVYVYSTYNDVFVRINNFITSPFFRFLAKIYSVILFNFRLGLLRRWSLQITRLKIESHSGLVDSFKYVFKVVSYEKNPEKISVGYGWNPYEAKDFLVSEGLGTGYYNSFFADEWYALSPMIEFSGGIIPDNIAYYIEGSEGVAKVLKLKVNVNNTVRKHQACEKLESIAEVLSLSSLSRPLSDKMKKAISCCNSYSEKIEDKTISFVVERWENHKFNGFDLKFLISTS